MNKEKMVNAIETERLVLFPYTKENLALFNNDLLRFEKEFGVIYHGEELDHLLKDFLNKLEKEIAEDEEHYLFFTEFLIVLKENDHIIGSIDYKYVPQDGVTEVGYGLNPKYSGHGYMTEALKAFLTFGKEQGIRTVKADTLPDNVSSQNVLKKCGFRFTHEDKNLWWQTELQDSKDNEMIKNIVFDISNVLAPFRFKEYLAEKGFDGAMIKRIIKASAMTPYWTEFEKGKLTQEEAMNAFIGTDPDIADELHKAYDLCSGIMGRYDYTEGWIDALKEAGYKLYCITNFTPAGYEQCYDCISFIERFDGCVFSFREGVVKPDPAIYTILLDRYGLKAEECVFIDDTEENVRSAEELGLKGIVFKGYEDAAGKLAEITQ